jgi:hypothetical protein
MQDNHLFEYAVIRVVPKVEREEFLNVGVILYCAKKKFIATKISVNHTKIACFLAEDKIQEVIAHLKSFEKIANGAKEGGPIALLDIPSRFRWLTATRSTIIQTSSVHPGLCSDNENALDRLYQQLVL